MLVSTYRLVLLNQVVACLYHNIVFIAKDIRDPASNPLLDQINVNLLDIYFLVELWREFGGLEALLVDAECHCER